MEHLREDTPVMKLPPNSYLQGTAKKFALVPNRAEEFVTTSRSLKKFAVQFHNIWVVKENSSYKFKF